MPVGDLPWLFSEYNLGVISEEVTAEKFAQAIQKTLKKTKKYQPTDQEKFLKNFQLENIVKKFINTIKE
jgi:hypothetical protein